QPLMNTVMISEFKTQIADYLKTTGPKYPKTFDDIVRLSNDPKTKYRAPEKAFALQYRASVALAREDPTYLAAANHGLPLMRTAVQGMFDKYKLDAIIYPTSP